MTRKSEDTFPYEAIADLASLCHDDRRITGDTDNETIVRFYAGHAEKVAERFGIPADILARATAHIVGPGTETGQRFMQAAGDPDNDFADTASRLGYLNMVRATTVFAEEPRLEIGLARSGFSVDRRWIVVEHSGCDPDRPERGSSMLDDFADFGDALRAYEALVAERKAELGDAAPMRI